MQFVLAIPVPLRLAVVFVVAAFAAALANAAIYHFAWRRRLYSAWQPADPRVGPRTWIDRVPIYGWWRLRRESPVHGAGHWRRPLGIELVFALGMAWLYWWETVAGGLVQQQLAVLLPGGIGRVDLAPLAAALHGQFAAHAVLVWLMLIATFIDLDEKTIPDVVTLPGAAVGMAFALLVPGALLPQITHADADAPIAGQLLQTVRGAPTDLYLEPVHLAAASPWPAALLPAPQFGSLVVALACYWLWCFAFVRRTWIRRRGWQRAVRHFLARAGRDWLSTPLREITLLGSLAVAAVWWWGGAPWVGLLSALVGLVGAGGTVWLIRILAGAALQREAMGFGDVLLMMMVGTYIGWQAGVMVFFLAPFAAILFGIVQLLVHRDDELPYGPFLCAATVLLVVQWDTIWLRASPLFAVPWLVPCVLLVCLVLCGALLYLWQQVKIRLWPTSATE